MDRALWAKQKTIGGIGCVRVVGEGSTVVVGIAGGTTCREIVGVSGPGVMAAAAARVRDTMDVGVRVGIIAR